MNLEALAGPAALAIAASLAVIALWREHQRSDHLKDDVLQALTTAVGQFPHALADLTAVVVDSTERERSRPRPGKDS